MKKRKQNSGVALIMVLGLLTVMVLMAVTFAISMRTERLAAGNYADTVRARELVHVGIARAMNDLAVNLGTSGLFSAGVKSACPSWNVTNSYYTNSDGSARWNTNIYLLRGEATNYVPGILWTEAVNADSNSLSNPSNHWLLVESLIYTNNGVDLAESNLIGRVAYLILNCSGLLDANYAGGAARQSGTNPAEIQIANLSEINAGFTAQRAATDIRYETLRELNTRADINKPAVNLFVYSRALPGDWDESLHCVGTQVNLSGTEVDLILRRNEIKNAFVRAGFPTESDVLYNNLIDYVDTNTIPQNLNDCVEPVPMINEVAVSNHIKVVTVPGLPPTYQYTIDGGVYIECWYPFVSNANEAYTLNSSVAFSGSIKPADITIPIVSTPFIPSAGSFTNIQFSFPPATIDSVSFVNPVLLISKVTLSIKNTSGQVVDQINGTIDIQNSTLCVLESEESSLWSRECLDPRFNANPAEWGLSSAAHTLGSINTWTKNYLAAATNNENDSAMFVANHPLRSAAELGYLAYAPWKTVKLYGPDRCRVLDVFGFSDNTNDVFMTNTVYRGRVNCNSNSALDATAVVFAGMPVDQYPGETATTIPMTNAQTLAAKIFNGGMTNLSDIGRNLVAGDFTGATNEFGCESYFRNNINLFNLRQNMFTVIIEAQAASGGNIPRNPAKQRAVAIVWRDPYTGDMFIRHIKWLGD